MKQDLQRINLSLVSHTNVGKTTLARTLLGRDIGEVDDRSHVTVKPEDYVLIRSPDDNELILWDTPGFGDSVRLAKRLQSRSNPIGWFTGEVWDRFADKSLWLNQQALKHIREKSNIILYLINASEPPESLPYVKSEMEILGWIKKPVIVLLNQMGKVRPAEEEEKEVQLWRDFLAGYPLVKAVLPLDAFARCWVQEFELWKQIEGVLTEAEKPAFHSLHKTWLRGKQAVYASSVEAMANYMVKLTNDTEHLHSQSLIERLRAIGRSLGFIKKDLHGAVEDAQIALSTRAADKLCLLTQKLITLNGLEGEGVKGEILRRLKSDWSHEEKLDPTAGAFLGAVAGGAVTGLAADIASGGLSFGAGTIGGAIAGALGGVGVTAAYNVKKGSRDNILSWSPSALEGFVVETTLLYLAIAHFGRGRGHWEKSESPVFWKETVEAAVAEQKIDFADLKLHAETADALQARYQQIFDAVCRETFRRLYGVTL
jgi:hypothetical protein